MAATCDATSVARVKDYSTTFGPSSATPAELDAVLNDIIDALSEEIERYLGGFLLKAARVYVPTIVRRWQRIIRLPHAPIDTAAAFEVKQASDRDFTSSTTILEPEGYYVKADSGLVLFDEALLGRAGTVQVTSTGGYAASATPDALETAAPGIVLAATMWVAETYRRRRSATKVTIGSRGNASATYEPMVGMPQQVRDILAPYRRPVFFA